MHSQYCTSVLHLYHTSSPTLDTNTYTITELYRTKQWQAYIDAMQSHSLLRTHYQASPAVLERQPLLVLSIWWDIGVTSLIPRHVGESAWYTLFVHALNRHRILSHHVRMCTDKYTYTGDVLVDVLVGTLFKYVLHHIILCLLVAGYLEIKLKKK